ncbi:hypothetical protein [Nonomuraea typhae]|uniref:hypothetical protein n=1 Tax=Nonomuraea typhae TaxID=2603600 RepID=UPI0012F970E8|nr:hypothetical protein [Nonomuraea typhae]
MSHDNPLHGLDWTPLLKHRLVWDLVPSRKTEKVMRQLGMVPPSTDAAPEMYLESKRRLFRVAPLLKDVTALSTLSAEILIATILGDTAEEVPAEIREALATQYGEVIRVGALVIIANLLDTGVITFPERNGRE